jgi:hypothetical protein
MAADDSRICGDWRSRLWADSGRLQRPVNLSAVARRCAKAEAAGEAGWHMG